MELTRSVTILLLISLSLLLGTPLSAEETFRVKKCLGGSCKNGRVHTVTVTGEYFIVTIDPRSCTVSHLHCPNLYGSFTVEGDEPVRVEGYEPGTRTEKMFTVYVPRQYKRLFVDGINKRKKFATIELHPYEKYVGEGAAAAAVVTTRPTSAVDEPTSTENRNPDALAVVFGVESYRYAPPAVYAENDAKAFQDYLVRRFGFEADRILFRADADATKGEFDRAFASDGWLARRATRESDVVVFIAGHGTRDPATGRAVLLPQDIDPAYAASGYPVGRLLDQLAGLNAASITVFLDVAFSGVDRGGQPLAAEEPQLRVAAAAVQAPHGVLLYLASGPKERNAPLHEESHGAFTFFLLDGLSGKADVDDDRRVTAHELAEYLQRSLSAVSENTARQNPQLLGQGTDRVILDY
jgi:hypothetical protein